MEHAAGNLAELRSRSRRSWNPANIDGTKMLLVMPGFVLPDQANGLSEGPGGDDHRRRAKSPPRSRSNAAKTSGKSMPSPSTNCPEDIRPHVQQMLGGK